MLDKRIFLVVTRPRVSDIEIVYFPHSRPPGFGDLREELLILQQSVTKRRYGVHITHAQLPAATPPHRLRRRSPR